MTFGYLLYSSNDRFLNTFIDEKFVDVNISGFCIACSVQSFVAVFRGDDPIYVFTGGRSAGNEQQRRYGLSDEQTNGRTALLHVNRTQLKKISLMAELRADTF